MCKMDAACELVSGRQKVSFNAWCAYMHYFSKLFFSFFLSSLASRKAGLLTINGETRMSAWEYPVR